MMEEILNRFHLKKTHARISVLELFLSHSYALSHSFLEKRISNIDRVTLYRTLSTFEDYGLIHRVVDDSGVVKYALCLETCKNEDSHHQHHHVHFQCKECKLVTCLEIEIPHLELPNGYQPEQYYFIVKGICKNCVNA